jgi:hypothetical protein
MLRLHNNYADVGQLRLAPVIVQPAAGTDADLEFMWTPHVHGGLSERPGCRLQDYLALRWRQPKPSERVRVAVKVSNSTGVGYGPEPDHAEVW